MKIVIIGGGATGFFLAANMPFSSKYVISIFEKASKPLRKVAVSGGGRCNLSHACFDEAELVNFYPRGRRELRGVFSRFQPSDTIRWFESRGVKLKTLEDDCIFPASNSSETITDLLIKESDNNDVKLQLSTEVSAIKVNEDGTFIVSTSDRKISADYLIVASGSNKSVWKILSGLGHTIVHPVPSLFSICINNNELKKMTGLVFENAIVSVPELGKNKAAGELLITHRGLSGPAVLKISSFLAREMSNVNYRFKIKINWTGMNWNEIFEKLNEAKNVYPRRLLKNINPLALPTRFWEYILYSSGISDRLSLANVSKAQFKVLADLLTANELEVSGRNQFKGEFVTCGGVELKEINLKTMESRLFSNLFLGGEVLDIDGLTGGFNLQACWSEAWVISQELLKRIG